METTRLVPEFFISGEARDYDTYGPHWIYHAVHGWFYWQLPNEVI